MSHRRRKNIRALLAAVLTALVLAGCSLVPREVPDLQPEEDPGDVDTPVTNLRPTHDEGYSRADSLFTVLWSPESSMNPMNGTNVYNSQIFGLLYESLFMLDRDLEAVPVLCQDIATEDGITWDLTLLPDVKFHDGTDLTANDVVYSLTYAKGVSKFSSRLSDISSVSPGETAGHVTIKLRRANYLLPKLLDVPIVKTDTAELDRPVGTGPYVEDQAAAVLRAFTRHRDYTPQSLDTVYLRKLDTDEQAEAFSERAIDLMDYDPTGISRFNIHMIHENRYYDTSSLIYLGFNCNGKVTRDETVRRAMMRLVNSEAICEDIFESGVRRSTFILNPVTGDYDESADVGYGFSRQDFTRLSYTAGLEDSDGDGYLDYNGTPMELKFIVNTESSYKQSAALRITTDLQGVGFNVTLDVLSYSDYERALKNGNFDLYIGEVRLRADLDPTELLTGRLNYGKAKAGEYKELINAYLAAPEGAERTAAGTALCLYAAEDAAIVPLCYKQRSVLTHVGVISGLEPSQSGPYRGILGWTTELGK